MVPSVEIAYQESFDLLLEEHELLAASEGTAEDAPRTSTGVTGIASGASGFTSLVAPVGALAVAREGVKIGDARVTIILMSRQPTQNKYMPSARMGYPRCRGSFK